MGRRSESGGGGEKSSAHRSRGHRSERDDADTSHRHRHHRRHRRRSEDHDDERADNNVRTREDVSSSGRHRHRRHHHHSSSGAGSGRGEVEQGSGGGRRRGDRSDAAARSRRRPRLDRRDSSRSGSDKSTNNHNNNNNSDDDYRSVEYDRREREAERRSRRRGHRADTYEDAVDVIAYGRKRHRGGGGGGGSQSDEGSDREEKVERSSLDDRRGHNQNANSNSRTVDWSSRRGRRQMPSLAYDVGQQKRLLGFLDRRDASGGHAGGSATAAGGGAAEMTFEIGPDGLVQMPPPNTLVRRRQYDLRTGGRREDRQQPPAYRTGRLNQGNGAEQRSNGDRDTNNGHGHGHDNDDNSSVASHESLYNDPSTAHLGILPDILPPSNLYRVALYGVDLSITARHLTSLVTQLLGKAAKPYRVRRPAREMLLAAIAYRDSGTASSKQNAPPPPTAAAQASCSTAASAKGVLPDLYGSESAPTNPNSVPAIGLLPEDARHSSAAPMTGSAGVLSTAPPSSGILPDVPAVLESGSEVSGVLGSGGNGADHDEGVLPDAASLPLPPPPAAPVFYLPGLHDVNGPGGMVVLEFAAQEHAFRTVQVLNGGYVNGRRIAASM
ncbi:hypothetical protein ABB37_00280 [Leptomonas pyrrhocoris]|uniref:Uncharacterized protein n=1 Tax=Leptomonas pyrrhocoris TaxID=157538 RepID=A0A0N0E034_LEPPY|nr:hypothetical protein ABB37_00280 [Leptomonas pyrrhocoris]KPA85991.1 hypothetical protein ABB37_00280 [Leptomonas pyrrhocoris]|eukprot:XP_015664430.1 hypothetical protein ABB37_00280 [Leptomonas pyrrhocoris]